MTGHTASELIEQFGASAFEAVHQSDLDGLIYFSGDGTIEYANRAAMQLFGLDETMIGRDVLELAANQFDDLSVELILPSNHVDRARDAYDKGTPSRSEMIVIDDGERREVEVMWGPVQRDGEIVGVVGSYRDVSSRPDIHDQLTFELSKLEKERRFFASLLDEIDDGVIVYDDHMKLRFANTSALDFLEVESPIEGMEIEPELVETHLESPERWIEQLERTRNTSVSSMKLYRPDRACSVDRHVEVRTSPLHFEESRYVCTMASASPRLEPQQADLLREIAQSPGEAPHLEALQEHIVASIARELEVDSIVLTTYDGELICPVSWRGLLIEEDMCIDPSTQAPLSTSLDRATPQWTEGWDWREGTGEGRGMQVIIPLLVAGEPLGTIHLGYPDPASDEALSPTLEAPPLPFLEALGYHVAAALHRARTSRGVSREALPWSSVLETLPWGVLLYNRQGDVLFANESAIRITGYRDWDNLNTDSPPCRLLDREDESPLARADWPFFEAVRQGEPCETDVLLDFETRRRDISLCAAPVHEDEPSPELFVGCLDDRTQQRRRDRRKDEFLSIASHELRSPLTPLTGVLQLARRQRQRGQDVDLSLLIRAERQVAQLTRLLDGLLDLNRIETGRFELEYERVQLGSIVERAARLWEHNPKDLEIEISPPDDPLEITLDPDRIEQVITNLIDNAVQYSQTDDAISIDALARGEEAVIIVEDHGVGMDEETIDRVFDRFFHGPDDKAAGSQSMGLGLYICRQIVEQHEGSIQIDSAQGEGTRIEIALPRRDGDGQDTE